MWIAAGTNAAYGSNLSALNRHAAGNRPTDPSVTPLTPARILPTWMTQNWTYNGPSANTRAPSSNNLPHDTQ